MPALPSPFDPEATGRRRAAQTDPLVMWIAIARRPRHDLDLLAGAACHAVLLARDRALADPGHAPAARAWADGIFRKVVLRARPGDFAAAAALPDAVAVQAGAGDEQERVLALAPRPRSAQPGEIRRMQAWSPAAGRVRGPAGCVPAAAWPPVVLVDAGLGMGTGKTLAQIGHAAMLAELVVWSDPSAPTRLAAWRGAGCPLHVVALPGPAFAAAVRAPQECVVVRDAGLTEVAAGSETVLMRLPPAPPSS